MGLKKELMTWERLKELDFESILAKYEVDIGKIEAEFNGAYKMLESNTKIQQYHNYTKSIVDGFFAVSKAISMEIELIHALKEGLWGIEIVLNDIDMRLSRLEDSIDFLQENK